MDSISLLIKDKDLTLQVLEDLLETNSEYDNEIKSVMLPLQYDMNDLEEDLAFRKRQLEIYYNQNLKKELLLAMILMI